MPGIVAGLDTVRAWTIRHRRTGIRTYFITVKKPIFISKAKMVVLPS